jgi:hypothetical protein
MLETCGGQIYLPSQPKALARIMQEKPRNTRNTRKAPNFKHVRADPESAGDCPHFARQSVSCDNRIVFVCLVFFVVNNPG